MSENEYLALPLAYNQLSDNWLEAFLIFDSKLKIDYSITFINNG